MKTWQKIAVFFAPTLYKIWSFTWRYEEIGREAVEYLNKERQPLVICLWHGETFPMWNVKRELNLAAIVSKSKDGEILTRIVTHFGFTVVRGSSSRGGAEALRGIVRVMRRDAISPCITMDGPRGPIHKIKDGVLFMAHFGKGYLVPTRVYAKRAIRLKSWDRYFIPLPFSRIRVIFGEPYALEVEKLDESALERERERLKQKMDEMDRYAF